jgi:hypothetical protein
MLSVDTSCSNHSFTQASPTPKKETDQQKIQAIRLSHQPFRITRAPLYLHRQPPSATPQPAVPTIHPGTKTSSIAANDQQLTGIRIKLQVRPATGSCCSPAVLTACYLKPDMHNPLKPTISCVCLTVPSNLPPASLNMAAHQLITTRTALPHTL